MKIFKTTLSVVICLVILICNVPIASALYGDADKSGNFTTDDVIYTMHFASGTKTPTADDIEACDVDRDGYVTVNDAYVILLGVAGQEEITQHQFTPWAMNAEPTCTVNGVATCKCEICHRTFRKIIPPTGHIYEGGICKGCGKVQADTFICYNGKNICFEASPESAKNIFGEPQDILTDTTAKSPVQIYIYCNDYAKLGVFTFVNNKLTQFYTNHTDSYVKCYGDAFTLSNYPQDYTKESYVNLGDLYINLYTDKLQKEPEIYSFCATYSNGYTFQSSTSFQTHEKLNFHLLNGCRAINGKAPLAYCTKVQRVAYAHSVDMAENNYFNHINLSGESVSDRINKAGISWHYCGENIAAGQRNAYQLNDGWYNSPVHRENMLFNYDKVGIGITYNKNSDYLYYSTQNFYSEW